MSIFFICSMACMTRLAFSGSLSPSIRPRAVGMICHDRPYLSCSQPHWSSLPPADSFFHSSSTSCCVSQFTNNEMAGLARVPRLIELLGVDDPLGRLDFAIHAAHPHLGAVVVPSPHVAELAADP